VGPDGRCRARQPDRGASPGGAYVLLIARLTPFCPQIATTIFAVKREIRWLLTVDLTVLCAGIAYFSYKLASLWLPRTRRYFDTTRNTLAVFCAYRSLRRRSTR
jgi:hypothetical protein